MPELLATTGVILNHTAALRLDSRFVRARPLPDLAARRSSGFQRR
jgi:hypothetical protein